MWDGRLGLALPLMLVLAAFLAPSGQAHSAAAGSQQEGATASTKATEKAERVAERAAAKEQRAAAKNAAREARQGSGSTQQGSGSSKKPKERKSASKERKSIQLSTEREDGAVTFGCSEVTYTFRHFPSLLGDSATEKLTVDGKVVAIVKATFAGPEGSNTIPIVGPPGRYTIDAGAKWKLWEAPKQPGEAPNPFDGAFDIHSKVECPATPAFTIEKLQQIAGAGGSFTTAPLTGGVGQTVDYEIVVKNTGNVDLTFSEFSDPHCEAGTISGGPGSSPLAPEASSTYTCTHKLDAADEALGSYANTATDTGTPPEGGGGAITHTSNTVIVELVRSPPEEKTTPPPSKTPGPAPSGANTSEGVGTLSSSSSATSLGDPLPQGGVLAFAGRVPSLRGPQGCVRRTFLASVRSNGVQSVTFFLDGRRLKTLTAKSAHKDLLSVTVSSSSLKIGAHRLIAKITMIQLASAARVLPVSRTLTFVRCRSALLPPRFTG